MPSTFICIEKELHKKIRKILGINNAINYVFGHLSVLSVYSEVLGKANILQLRAHGDTAYTTIESRTLFDICKKNILPIEYLRPVSKFFCIVKADM